MDVENLYRDIPGFDLSYDEKTDLFIQPEKEKFFYLMIHRLKDEDKEKYCIMKILVKMFRLLFLKRMFFERFLLGRLLRGFLEDSCVDLL